MTQLTRELYGTHLRRAARPVRGISLIEVLVAIALLTIGVLSVIILFPAGFLTLEIAANATNGDRIGQRELEKLNTANSGQMAVIASIYSNYDAAIPAGTAPNLAPSLAPAGQPSYQPVALGLNSDINAYRLVKGETIRVPVPITYTDSSSASHTVSLYTPAFAPIISPSNVTLANQPPDVFAVHGLPWSRLLENSGGLTAAPDYGDPAALLGTNQPQYLIDYANGKIAVPQASYTQTVLFKFTDGTNSTAYPAGITYHVQIVVPAANSGQWFDPFQNPMTSPETTSALVSSMPLPTYPTEPSLPWKSGSDILSRDFQPVNQPTPTSALVAYDPTKFTADPYQYQTYSLSGTTVGSGDISGTTPIANLGTIAFNPIGASIKDTNGRPLMASIDYEVYDWHIISEDRTASSSSGATSPAVRLSLRSLYAKGANDLFSDNTKYTGLFYGTPAGSNLDVTVLDLQKGTVLTQSTPSSPNDFSVNYPDGVISINNASEVDVPLRVFYRAREDWGVALSRAPSNYVLSDLPSATYLPQYGECALDAPNQVLYFPLADIGKTVDVSGLIAKPGTTAIPNADLGLQTITKDPSNARGLISLATAGSLSGSPFPTGTQLATVQEGQSGTVEGSTIEAQVIWKEQGIWKHREITTVIPANATQMALHQ